MSKTLSVIIPTLNEERVIEKLLKNMKTIKSIDYELIVSDGGSTDKTVKIAKKYADKVIENNTGKRQNIAIGRNLGAKKAKGKYFVFIDADVFVPEPDNSFNMLISYLEKDKDLLAICPKIRVFPNETLSDRIVFGIGSAIFYFCNNILHYGAAGGEFQLIKSSAFRKLGGYNEKLVVCEDQDMFKRLSKKGKTYFETSLCVTHTGRRAKNLGWSKLLRDWVVNYLAYQLFNRSLNYEWEVVR